MTEPLIDSTIWIDHMNGRPEATSFVLGFRGDERMMMHAIVAAELICGAKNKAHLRGAEATIAQCRLVIPPTTTGGAATPFWAGIGTPIQQTYPTR